MTYDESYCKQKSFGLKKHMGLSFICVLTCYLPWSWLSHGADHGIVSFVGDSAAGESSISGPGDSSPGLWGESSIGYIGDSSPGLWGESVIWSACW